MLNKMITNLHITILPINGFIGFISANKSIYNNPSIVSKDSMDTWWVKIIPELLDSVQFKYSLALLNPFSYL